MDKEIESLFFIFSAENGTQQIFKYLDTFSSLLTLTTNHSDIFFTDLIPLYVKLLLDSSNKDPIIIS